MSTEQPVGSVFVAQGSIYSPGWHVVEQVRERYQRVLATFDDKVDTEEFLVLRGGDDLTTQLRATLIALGQPVDVEDYAPPVGVPVDLDVPR